jgi:hypothetical protein
MENNVDKDVQYEYAKKKMMTENYPLYAYYTAIQTVADSILPKKVTRYLDILGLE